MYINKFVGAFYNLPRNSVSLLCERRLKCSQVDHDTLMGCDQMMSIFQGLFFAGQTIVITSVVLGKKKVFNSIFDIII